MPSSNSYSFGARPSSAYNRRSMLDISCGVKSAGRRSASGSNAASSSAASVSKSRSALPSGVPSSTAGLGPSFWYVPTASNGAPNTSPTASAITAAGLGTSPIAREPPASPAAPSPACLPVSLATSFAALPTRLVPVRASTTIPAALPAEFMDTASSRPITPDFVAASSQASSWDIPLSRRAAYSLPNSVTVDEAPPAPAASKLLPPPKRTTIALTSIANDAGVDSNPRSVMTPIGLDTSASPALAAESKNDNLSSSNPVMAALNCWVASRWGFNA